MTAFFIATAKIKDPNKLQSYVEQAMATIQAHSGNLLLKGNCLKSLSQDDINHDFCVIFTFPNLEALNQWHASDAYQALIELRKQAIDAVITVYESADA